MLGMLLPRAKKSTGEFDDSNQLHNNSFKSEAFKKIQRTNHL